MVGSNQLPANSDGFPPTTGFAPAASAAPRSPPPRGSAQDGLTARCSCPQHVDLRRQASRPPSGRRRRNGRRSRPGLQSGSDVTHLAGVHELGRRRPPDVPPRHHPLLVGIAPSRSAERSRMGRRQRPRSVIVTSTATHGRIDARYRTGQGGCRHRHGGLRRSVTPARRATCAALWRRWRWVGPSRSGTRSSSGLDLDSGRPAESASSFLHRPAGAGPVIGLVARRRFRL